MVNFIDLMPGSNATLPDTLEGTFQTLDRKTTHVDLRPGQIELLSELDRRIDDHDVVMRVSTGGGKTVIALLYLYHLMKRDHLASVYLVPTTQLVDQVIQEAGNIGIPAYAYPKGEKYPNDACVRAEAIIVCTYDKLFNGRSTFLRDDVAIVPGAIVLDDVHAGIEEVRGCYSARLPDEAFVELRDFLDSSMNEQAPGVWPGVVVGDENAVVDVPFWIWVDHLEQIRQIFERYKEEGELRFSWKHLSDRLELARCTISGSGAEVSLDPAPVNQWRPYGAAKHRLFMSASINDGSALIRELDCSAEAVAQQLASPTDRGPGERMIITTSLVDPYIERGQIAELASQLKAHANVVVLVSSKHEARDWCAHGAVHVEGDDVSRAIKLLRTTRSGNYLVFAQRYDGVDLPDDACRILIIDGVPRGEKLVDKLDQQGRGNVAGTRNRTVNRLEQGLGRAVRSQADYCAVLLVGRDLGGFIGQTATLDLLSSATKQQLQMSREISKQVGKESDLISAIRGTIMQSLTRDPTWRRYYAQYLSVSNDGRTPPLVDNLKRYAAAERRALAKALSRDFVGASREINEAVNESQSDAPTCAVLSERMARYTYLFDKATAHDIQRKAYGKDHCVSRPISTVPTRIARASAQAEKLSEWLRQYSIANAAIADLETLKNRVMFGNAPKAVEGALYDLGRCLGAEASRPENETGRGPDVLWRFPSRIFVIEAKSDNSTSLHKSDAEQLHLSVAWFNETYQESNNVTAVIASNTRAMDRKIDFAFGAHCLTEDALFELIARLKSLVTSAVIEGGLFTGSPENIQGHIVRHKLLPQNILELMELLH